MCTLGPPEIWKVGEEGQEVQGSGEGGEQGGGSCLALPMSRAGRNDQVRGGGLGLLSNSTLSITVY